MCRNILYILMHFTKVEHITKGDAYAKLEEYC